MSNVRAITSTTPASTRFARRWWRQIGVGVFSLVIAVGLGLGAPRVSANEETPAGPNGEASEGEELEAEGNEGEENQEGRADEETGHEARERDEAENAGASNDDDNDEAEDDGGVTARYGEDAVTVPALWIAFVSEASDSTCVVEDSLSDRVRLAYLHSELPAELGVRLTLTAERATEDDVGEVAFVREDEVILNGPSLGSHTSMQTFDWAPPREGTYRFQLTLEVTEVPGREQGRPAPNPERLRARSPWHHCDVRFEAETPALAVVDERVEARWLDDEAAGARGEPRMAEVTVRLTVRSHDTAASLRSASRFEYAEPLAARWRAVLPPAGRWHNSQRHAVASGESITVERRFRFAEAHWPSTLALQLEREDVAPQEPRRVALVELDVAEPSAFAVAGTLTRFLPDTQRVTDVGNNKY